MKTFVINYESETEISKIMHEKFLESFDWDSDDRNFKYDFKIMTKKYGRQFIDYCKVSWLVNREDMTEEDFCKMNANIPLGFFKSKICPSRRG